MSDLSGIQARGGCSCAGPCGHSLLGIDREAQLEIERQVLRGQLGIKPGCTRISFVFFTSEIEIEYIVKAVHFVAEHGSRLLSDYELDPSSGRWSHRDGTPQPVTRLSGIRFADLDLGRPAWDASLSESALHHYLDEAAAAARTKARWPRSRVTGFCSRTASPTLNVPRTSRLSDEIEEYTELGVYGSRSLTPNLPLLPLLTFRVHNGNSCFGKDAVPGSPRRPEVAFGHVAYRCVRGDARGSARRSRLR